MMNQKLRRYKKSIKCSGILKKKKMKYYQMLNGPHEKIKPHHNNMLNTVNILLFVFIVLFLKIYYYVYTMIFYILVWVFQFETEQNVKQNRMWCQHEISFSILRFIWVRIATQ